MMDDQITLTDCDDRLYQRGLIVAHSSDESGIADVGTSVGLGDAMLYAGEVPDIASTALVIYPNNPQSDRVVVAESVDYEAAQDMMTMISRAMLATREDRDDG
jgi:hypothetical protein